jgi:hypothetical protein
MLYGHRLMLIPPPRGQSPSPGLPEIVQALLRGALKIGLVAVVIVGLFIAWWIALLAVGGLIAYAGVTRLLGRHKAPPPEEGTPVTLEGEYHVEPEALVRDDEKRRRP